MLHPAQQTIARSKARFKVLVCGRRFGKTVYEGEEATAACIYQPNPVRYFATTRDQAREILWNDLIRNVAGTANYVKKDETRLEVTLKSHLGFTNTITLGGWENIEASRGKKTGLLLLDEVDSMRGFDTAWNEVLRPTLTDTKGRAIFSGTPKGYKTLYRLSQRPAEDSDFEYFHFTSYDNPLIDPSEIDKAKRELSPNQFAQEYLAQFKKMEGLIYDEFDRDRHVKPCPFEPVRWLLCIDFGYNHPLAAYILAVSADDHIHVARELYKQRLDDQQRLSELRKLIADTPLDGAVGDSEDPIAILQLGRDLGINLEGAVKGKDSVVTGINMVQSVFHTDELTIDPSCENLCWELENYAWKLDSNNQPTDQPVKEDDDACDSIRYGVMKIRHMPHEPRIRSLT